MIPTVYVVTSVFLAALVYRLRSSSSSKLPLPPGPPKRPFIKNLLDFPLGHQWITFASWSKDYNSDIIHVEAIGKSLVILNSYEAMTDLLDKRSAIYSSRAFPEVINDMIGWNWLVSFMPYNDAWKDTRRLLAKHIQPNTSFHKFHETQQLHIFLNHLLDEPEDFLKHVRQMVGASTIAMAYGIKVRKTNDPYVALAQRTMTRLSEACLPGSFLVDTFDWLRHIPEGFPGTGWKAKIRDMQREMHEFRDKPYQAALDAIANSTSTDSFVSRCQQGIDEKTLPPREQALVKDAAAVIYAAGNETTVSVFSTFFLAIVCFPEVYKKAQAEVDKVLKGRLSEDSDIASLPYLSALVKEVLRWQPVMPMGLFHAVIRDDEYKGYHIPAGSLIAPNVWAVLHDPELFPDPEIFKPERFIKDGKLHVSGVDPSINFGFGRRVCPGRYIAESQIFHSAAAVLSLFDITKALDDNGNTIEPSGEYTNALSRHPLPFKCSIRPRSKDAEKLIRSLSDDVTS